MSDKEKLFEFYKQKPFMNNAVDVINQMIHDYINRTKMLMEEM